MKELSIEEKAKRYDEAIERAKAYQELRSEMEIIFPELAESEDERMSKYLIKYFEANKDELSKGFKWNGITVEECIDWLEKQGKPIDKIVKRAMTEKQRVLLTETNGDANIDWDTRSLKDAITLLEHGLNYLQEIEVKKQTMPSSRFGGCSEYIPTRFDKEKQGKQGEQNLPSFDESQGTPILKQGEQKPVDRVEPKDYCSIDPHFFKTTDKVESKFKVGDWVIGRATHNEPRQIAEVTKEGYKTAYGGWYGFSWEEDMHLWTIEDAKDGDILSWDDSKCIALFKNIYDDVSFNSYGFVGHCTGTFESRPTFHDIDGAHPASKEQRDLLFQKMKEAGYEWDTEKKELKEIHVIDEDKAEMDYCFTKMMNGEKVCPSWNDYDEMMFRNTISLIETLEDINKAPDGLGDVKSWLKSLKERVQPQPKQEWGEEDSKRLQRIIDFLWYNRKGDTDTIYQQEQDIEWLKSLRPQTTWKPSGEQIDILDMVLTNESMDDNITRILRELREQLKKLREE